MKACAVLLPAWLVACATAPSPAPVARLAATIEPSDGVDEAKPPLGDGDPEATQCFRDAAANQGERVARCRDHEAEQCAELATALAPRKPACAMKLWELACNVDHARSCNALATQLLQQPHPPVTRVRKLLTRACDGALGTACTTLAKLDHDTLQRYDPDIVRLLQRGCELGDGEACFLVADRGGTENIDEERARLFERGCDLGYDRACLVLGQALMQGAGPNGMDGARGQQMLAAVCAGTGDAAGDACFVLGQLATTDRAEWFRRGCEHDQFNACIEVLVAHHAARANAEAIALATRLLAEDGDQWFPRWARASALFNTGEHKKSIPDLEVLIDLRRDWPLLEIWLYAARERSGGDGQAGLQQAMDDLDETGWPLPVFRFMLGKISAAQLLQQAKDVDSTVQRQQECEAFYYIGQRLLIQGKAAQARQMFQKAVDTQVVDYIEFTGAAEELARAQP